MTERCNICGRRYKTKRTLGDHRRQEHAIYVGRTTGVEARGLGPVVCDCETPDPIPSGMGECASCRRLIAP